MLDLSPSFHFTGAQFVHVSRRWSYSTHILTHNPYRAQCQACTPLSLMWQITAASVPLVMDRFLRSPLLLYLSTLCALYNVTSSTQTLFLFLLKRFLSNIRTVMDASGTTRAQYPAPGCLTWAARDWTTDSLVSSWPPARAPELQLPLCVCVKWSIVVVLWSHISYGVLIAN